MHIGTPNQPMLVKRYAERRLYRCDTARYITRKDLISMARRGEPFVVVDAKTGADVTSAFRPITVEH
jgi:polyhydroxyalkanoate synthesis regulator protein